MTSSIPTNTPACLAPPKGKSKEFIAGWCCHTGYGGGSLPVAMAPGKAYQDYCAGCTAGMAAYIAAPEDVKAGVRLANKRMYDNAVQATAARRK